MSATPQLDRLRVLNAASPPARIVDRDAARMLYFQCSNKSPSALLATEVDLVEFAGKVEDKVAAHAEARMRAKCIEFVQARNPELARALRTYLGQA